MKFRHKLLFFGIAVAAVTAIAVFLAGGAVIRASVGDRVRERLEREILVLADALSADSALLPALASAPLDERIDAFANRTGGSLGLRVTVVALDGRVLGDSALDGEDLKREENHASRPEIIEARRNGSGSSVRTSVTVHDKLLYVARRIERDGRPVGFVRLAIPVAEIERTTGGYSEKLGLLSFLILLAVAVFGYVVALGFSRPIEEMSRTADAIAAGQRDLEVEYTSGDEIGHLGAAVNRMARALADQIRAISSEKRLRDTIFAGMQEGILVLDTDRRVLLCNDALRALLGLRGQDPTGRPMIEIVRDRAVVQGFDAALMRGEEYREIVPVLGGSDRAFDITIAPLADASGGKVGAIALFFDVTRLMALENVRREFVADASHELRTPLTSIKAFVETLLAGGLEDPANNRRFLEIIKKHSDRMEAILDDLTDLSLIETGSIVLAIEPLDLALIVQELIESLRPKAEARGVSLLSEIAPGVALSADRRRIEQILLNLLDNAIKFNRPGGTVTIRAAASPPGGGDHGRVRLEVEDTGIGITSDAFEKIFHRFYRVDRSRSREMGGTGLGLAIVKHLVRLQGGSVRVESEPGRGSRFILEFP